MKKQLYTFTSWKPCSTYIIIWINSTSPRQPWQIPDIARVDRVLPYTFKYYNYQSIKSHLIITYYRRKGLLYSIFIANSNIILTFDNSRKWCETDFCRRSTVWWPNRMLAQVVSSGTFQRPHYIVHASVRWRNQYLWLELWRFPKHLVFQCTVSSPCFCHSHTWSETKFWLVFHSEFTKLCTLDNLKFGRIDSSERELAKWV